ncbi:hypothetical protein ABH313_02975, partial [Chromobacterium vaccinii]|uniref:hypothetical protein n=1 Tax=Chromobacterium vaccinii TaxID=1108595 RepID=UPI00325FE398
PPAIRGRCPTERTLRAKAKPGICPAWLLRGASAQLDSAHGSPAVHPFRPANEAPDLRRAPLSHDWYGLRRQALAQLLREVLFAVLRRLTSAPARATPKTVLKNRCNRQFGFYIDGYSISINQNNYIKYFLLNTNSASRS